MPVVCFRGRILPAIVEVSFTDVPKGQWVWQQENMTLEMSVNITKSKIAVEITLDRYEDVFIAELHKRAFDLSRGCVNVAAFASGLGLAPFFDEFIRPGGISSPFLTTNPQLADECTAFNMNPQTLEQKKDLESILALIMKEHPLSLAINDMVQAFSTPHAAPANCGRVVDAMRNMVAPALEAKKGWPVLQETIKADEAYLRFIMEHSKAPRHGDSIWIDGPTTTEIVARTYKLFNRLLELRKRNFQSLPVTEFPILKG